MVCYGSIGLEISILRCFKPELFSEVVDPDSGELGLDGNPLLETSFRSMPWNVREGFIFTTRNMGGLKSRKGMHGHQKGGSGEDSGNSWDKLGKGNLGNGGSGCEKE